jgi:hypothetical protein
MSDFNQQDQKVGTQYTAGKNVYVIHQEAQYPTSRPDSIPVRVVKAIISTLFVSGIATVVVTFIIKVFLVLINIFQLLGSTYTNSPSGPNIGPDTYTQVMAQRIAAQCEHLSRRSGCRSNPSIMSAILEEDRSCGRGNHQSGRWCATNPWR